MHEEVLGFTLAPAAPSAKAMALPMPLEDPVTTQTGVSTALTQHLNIENHIIGPVCHCILPLQGAPAWDQRM